MARYLVAPYLRQDMIGKEYGHHKDCWEEELHRTTGTNDWSFNYHSNYYYFLLITSSFQKKTAIGGYRFT